MRQTAFIAVVLSTLATTSFIVGVPLFYTYLQRVQSNMQNELDFCLARSRNLWSEVIDLYAAKGLPHRIIRQAGYGPQDGTNPTSNPSTVPATYVPATTPTPTTTQTTATLATIGQCTRHFFIIFYKTVINSVHIHNYRLHLPTRSRWPNRGSRTGWRKRKRRQFRTGWFSWERCRKQRRST